MNKIKEIERDLKVAYLNYEDDDLKEALKYLDKVVAIIIKDDKTLERDPFWKALIYYVFKAIMLNNFHDETELTIHVLESLLRNELWVNKNLKEFCYNFRNNKEIDFIKYLGKIGDKPLKAVISRLLSNIEKLDNDKKDSQSKNEKKSNEYTQEELREFFCRRMTEAEEARLNQLDLKEKINKLTNFRYQIKYLEEVGYIFIEEGFFVLKDGGEPKRFSAKVFKRAEEAFREIEKEFEKKSK